MMCDKEKAAQKAWCWAIAKAELGEAILIMRWMKRKLASHGRHAFDALEMQVYQDKILRRLGTANKYRALAKSGYADIHIHPRLSF